MIEKKNIEIDGTKIFYVDARPDEPDRIAPTLLLVHGLFVSSASWEDVIPGLAARYRVVAPDLPGQGESDIWKNKTVSFSRYASFINTFCEKLGIKSAVIVGHSMGGGIAIVAASMYGQLFKKAVFMDSIAYPFKQPFKARAVAMRGIGEFIFKKIYGWGMFRAYFRNDVTYNKSKLNEKRLKMHFERFDPPERRDFAYSLVKMIANPTEVESRVAEVALPSLVVWGGKDILVPLACGHRLAKEIKGARIEIVPDCGHAPQEEQPGLTLEILQKFIQ